MNVVIIEDESIAARRLNRLLNQLDDQITVCATLVAVEEAINWFQQNPVPDLIFIDVQLEDGISFEIFDVIQISCPVIFTTAFDKYALKAFKQNSVDYLLKPIDAVELSEALDKYRRIHVPSIGYPSEIVPGKVKERFLVKVGERYRSIPSESIVFFYIEERSCFIQTVDNRHYAIDYSLDKIESALHTGRFFRINRSVVVNFSAIKEVAVFSNSRLKIISELWTGHDLLVSRDRVASFKQWMDR